MPLIPEGYFNAAREAVVKESVGMASAQGGELREIPKGHLFSPEEAAARRMWAEQFIATFKGVARAAGYGIFVGGSLVRDIDLVAVPWREPMQFKTPDLWVLDLHHTMGLIHGNHGHTIHGHRWFSLWDPAHPDHQIDLKIIMPAGAQAA